MTLSLTVRMLGSDGVWRTVGLYELTLQKLLTDQRKKKALPKPKSDQLELDL